MRRINSGLFREEEGTLDRGIVGGLILSFGLLLIGTLSSGRLSSFVDAPSFLLVIGGTIGATLINYSLADIGHTWQALKRLIRVRKFDPVERIHYLVKLAQAVKGSGLLVLEREARYVEDPFMRMALELAVDNQPADDLRRILETERRTANDHTTKAVQVLETMGAYAPALGLIGTLIGLIQMLGALDNPATVGPAMALALITTFYGAIAANLLFLPLAGKLRNRAGQEAMIKALTIEGTVSLVRQENSIVVEQRLQGYLPRMAA